MKKSLCIFLIVASGIWAGCSTSDHQVKQQEANKQLVLNFWETFYNQKNYDKAFQSFAEDAIYESFATGMIDSGRAKIQQNEVVFPIAFPDGKFKSEGIFADGEYVILRWNADGSNTVSLMGMPPTNKYVVVRGVQIFQITNGQIRHVWDYWNMADFMSQMGIGS